MKITREAMSDSERAKLGRKLGGGGTPPVAASPSGFQLGVAVLGACLIVVAQRESLPWWAVLLGIGIVAVGSYRMGRASAAGASELRPVLAREQARVGELVSVLIALGLRANDGAAGRRERTSTLTPRTEPRPSAGLDLPGERNGGHAYGVVAPGDADPLDSTGDFG